MDEIEKGWVRSDHWEKASAAKVNMEFLSSPLRCEAVNGVTYPADRLKLLIANNTPTHTSPHLPTQTMHNASYTINSPIQSNLGATTPSRLDAK